MTLEEFRRRHRSRPVRAGGLIWKVIDVGVRRGAPALVLLPGTLGTAEIWWNQIAALTARFRIVSVTYPRTGEIDRLADSLALLLRRLDVARAGVAGSSLGGYLAQIFAARHPALVETLFIGNSLSDPGGPHPSGISAARLKRKPGAFHRKMILDSVRSWPVARVAERKLIALLLENGTHVLSAKALKMRVLALRAGPIVPKLAIPDERVVIIDCADDPLIPRSVQDDVRRRYPRAHAYRLRRGGHYPYVLDPRAYTTILARHVRQRRRPRVT